ncbi:hypothetical protein EPN96_12585 [bacterium]|nr:MAG: hypothetical protein EPN96_12585 [bacterium]
MSVTPATTERIRGIADECLNELMEHLLQNSVNSAHIKNVRDKLLEIKHLCDAEEGSLPQPPTSATRRRLGGSKKEDVLKIAYAMSRFDYPIINEILKTSYNQTEAFDYLEKITGTKATTLRNHRDRFDRHVKQEASARKGWDVELAAELRPIKREWDQLSREQIKEELTKIIGAA